MTDAFDPDWPHGHTCGRYSARILATDVKSDYPIVAAVMKTGGKEELAMFTKEGRDTPHMARPYLDLLNAPAPKRRMKGWIALQESIAGPRGYLLARVYSTREQALMDTRRECLAVFEFDVEEGEGL